MATIYDVSQQELISKLAEELKKIEEIKAPVWANYVKTGTSKERPPVKEDWWYSRAASILKNIYRLGPIGTEKLRTKYGGRKNKGVKPEHFYKGSGSIIRKCLQQLEKAGLIKQDKKGVHKGRVMTPKGKSVVDKVASQIAKSFKKPEVKHEVKAEPVKHEKTTEEKVKNIVEKAKMHEKGENSAEKLVEELKK